MIGGNPKVPQARNAGKNVGEGRVRELGGAEEMQRNQGREVGDGMHKVLLGDRGKGGAFDLAAPRLWDAVEGGWVGRDGGAGGADGVVQGEDAEAGHGLAGEVVVVGARDGEWEDATVGIGGEVVERLAGEVAQD